MTKVFLKRVNRRLSRGHLWIYDNEISKTEGDYENGDIVDIFRPDGTFFGKGYINDNSKIRVRILTWRNDRVDRSFIEKRIKLAIERRKKLVKDTDAFRVVHGEGDFLPGLIVDFFNGYLVIQITTLGMERMKSWILDCLINIFQPKGIYEKSSGPFRGKEGLENNEGWIYGEGPELIEFRMNGLKFLADTRGQKTGFFLDQRENARMVLDIADGKVCLDVFSYTGNFAVHLLKGGAKHVTLVDYSERSLEIAKEILKMNGFKDHETIVGNAFDLLKSFDKDGKRFDLVVLDPPSFAKSSRSLESAKRGYKEVNLRAMRILKKPGVLVTSSCTQIVSEEIFREIIMEASYDTKTILSVLKRGGQPSDHPALMNVPETQYLKFYIFHVDKRW
ncbi:class I SAM-dependent rRNA methyltransferase [Thermotoga sp. KOL6]|uniref:class I SAM-dependent rRNA methyltransferase n=1 Tax=Thermotoga sp. KOL6 TaxID=126741 RepID=UPI000C794CCF|nr:class I SAM-dependent rRNA methyltransferase [Thermotoga sp. KOL6]PLV60083.1 SAM-dependent methyltransferase [Thermotoga sp. KOL6]